MQILTHLLPSFVSGDIILGLGRVNTEAGNYSEHQLSDTEKKVWRNFKSMDRRREYLATRGLIFQMVQHMQLDPDLFVLGKNDVGNPYALYKDDNYEVSIAHTREHVLCGISGQSAMGVDLEPCRREVPQQLLSRILNDSELQLLQNEPALRLWTIKEALVKLQGQGMRINLDDWTITSKKDRVFTAKFNDDIRAKICSFKHAENWVAFAWKC